MPPARGHPGALRLPPALLGCPPAVRAAAVLAALALIEGAACVCGGDRPLGVPARQGTMTRPGIQESSGIVASRRHRGVYWTHNDSGGGAVLYAIDATGRSLGEVRVLGATNVDWEDIAADPGGRLYLADVGDNTRARTHVVIYTVPEPDPRADRTVRATARLRLSYPPGHGPQNCEAVFVRKGWAYLVTKETLRARLYRAPLAGADDEVRQAEPLGPLPEASWITAADLSPDGRRLALLSYSSVYVYELPRPMEELAASRPAQAVTVRPRRRAVSLLQAEAVCWVLDAAVPELLITNEQRDVYRLRAERPATAPSRPAR